MEIHQGSSFCTVGFVELQLRIALTTAHCGDGSVVTDRDGEVLGTVVLDHRNTTDTPADDGSMLSIEYEVVRLAPTVTATDVLPTGRHLQSKPGLLAQQELPVCVFGMSSGQTCGRVSSVNNGRFAIADIATHTGEFGGPVYALTDGNEAVIVGLFEGTGTSIPEATSMPQAESWQAVMKQLLIDTRAPGPQPPPVVVRTAGAEVVNARR